MSIPKSHSKVKPSYRAAKDPKTGKVLKDPKTGKPVKIVIKN